MNKFLRNCMTAGVLALGLAACGDDVTVTQPPAPPAVPNITSFSVAPAAVTLTVGQVVQASYNLQLAPGLTGTVAYISGTSSVATIDATGKITAVAVGTSVVTATATSGGQTSVATIGVTVIAAPVVDAIQDFTVSPTSVTMIAGTTTQASYNLQLAPGLSGAVAWGPSTVPAVATINASGVISAVAPGTTSIPVTATSAGQTSTVTIGVTVVAVTPASLSIASVTQGLLTLPVNLSNVNGQIEINLNFSPGGQQIDSIVSYIGTKRASVQSFSSSATPTAGVISMSVNTANFRKNFSQAGVATAGATQVDFLNGPTTVNAIVYPKALTGQSAGNCTNAPPGVPAICSSNTFSIVLNNMDSWAADMTKPTNSALSNAASAAPGQTYWGGPAAAGVVSSTLYPVIYTPGRSITTVTWTIGGCGAVVQTALPFTQSFGYVAPAQTSCVGYRWVAGIRDNLAVGVAIDNAANVYGPFAGLIPNTVVFNSTPDSVRLDYAAPTVTTPTIARTLPAVTGWVNASFPFAPAASTDNAGVGTRATPDRAFFYDAPNCGGATAVSFDGTGATISECASNFIGGTPGLGLPGTAPYQAYLTESDRLGNVGTSSLTQTFGVDKTNPSIRWGTAEGAIIASTAADTVWRNAAARPSVGTSRWRAEYLDDRAGFYNNAQWDGTFAAQTHALSRARHVNPTGACVVGTGTPGATFVTAPSCTLVPITAAGAVRLDGWQLGQDVLAPDAESYYGYTTLVTDAAGNNSSTLFRKALVNTLSPFSTGLGVPGTVTSAAWNIAATFADSAEIVAQSLQIEYPNFAGLAGGAVDSVRYSRTAVGTAFDNVITSPFTGVINPGTPAPYVRHLEAVDGTAFPGYNVMVAPTATKPISVAAWSWNHGSTFTTGTPPAPGRSATIALPPLNVQDGVTFNTFNTGNVTNSVTHFRLIPSLATTNWFGSIVPLRAQAVSPTNTPNAPFVRVDFYRYEVAGPGVQDHWNYIGSSNTIIGTDQGTYRSWVYELPYTTFTGSPPVATGWAAVTWNGTASGVLAVGNRVVAVGVTAAGDGLAAGFVF